MVIKELTIANNFVAGFTLDVTFVMLVEEAQQHESSKDLPSKAYTTGIFFKRGVIKTLLHRQSTRPRVIVLSLVLERVVLFLFGFLVNLSIVEVLGDAHARQQMSLNSGEGGI